MKVTRSGTPRISFLVERRPTGQPKGEDPVRRWLRGALWLTLYVVAVLSPLLVLLVGSPPADRDFWTELSVGAGFVGLSVLCLQFVLTARFRQVAAPYGMDMILQFHRQIAFTALALVLAHPIILLASDHWAGLGLLNVFTAPWGIKLGITALLALALLIGLSVGRQALRLSYEAWRASHGVLAILVVAAGLGHILTVGHYLDLPWKRALWDAFILGMVGLLFYTRLGKPLRLWRRPYMIDRVEHERGDTTTIVLKPVGHAGRHFHPGQFAWVRLGDTPFSLQEHPFSYSSSAENPHEVAFTIKALGDFTATVRDLRPGTKAYVDGPYGAFGIDRLPPDAAGFVLVAGGVGITPFVSILRTMADRGDRRPVTLLYASRNWEVATFREELDALADRMRLTVVHVLDKPPEGWQGERGFVTPDLLARHLPEDRRSWYYLLCGPPPMMAAVERTLLDLGVPVGHLSAERFNLV
jgi:3-phenylpropionate/trans-cinnamate dioxygenase ferredoxin reductase subunit